MPDAGRDDNLISGIRVGATTEPRPSVTVLVLARYRAGPARKVPGRRRAMTYTEEDGVDDEATSHRRLEE
jgi:hypothetical protein